MTRRTRGPAWAPWRTLGLAPLLLLASSCTESEAPPAMDLAIEVAEEAVEPVKSVAPPARPAVPKRPLVKGDTLETLQGIGLVRPMAALHDPTADVYLVSNAGRDGSTGFITSLLPDGGVESLRWIDGAEVPLNAPAAMTLIQNRIVVADGDHLRVFDRETGAPRGAVHVEGAIALKDIAAGTRGDIFATDSGISQTRRTAFGAVYRMNRRGVVEVVSKSSVLGRPTGVIMVDGTAWIAAVEPEKFYGISSDGGLVHGAALPHAGGFAGLTRSGDQIFFSSPETRTVYTGPIEGPFTPVVMAVDSPGDVGWDAARRRLLVPRTDDDTLELHTLTAALGETPQGRSKPR